MNNKRKKSNFLKNLLTTASIASVIVGGSNSAFAAAKDIRGNVNLDNALNVDPAAFASGDWLTYDGGGVHTVNANIAGGQIIASIDTAGAAGPGELTVTTQTNIGSIGTSANNNLLAVKITNGQNLILTATAAGGILDNVYTQLGAITFHGGPGVLTIRPTVAHDLDFANTTIVNGQHATINIENNASVTKFGKSEIAKAHTINIADGSTVQFHSTETAGGVLQLQQVIDDVINFGDEGKGKLLLTSQLGAGNVISFTVMNGSLGGSKVVGADREVLLDNYGVISFDGNNVAGSTLGVNAANAAVIGRDVGNRAKKFIVTANANAATVAGNVYTKALELNGGNIIFNGIIDVGGDGSTKMTKASTVTMNFDATLGAVDFNNLGSTIDVVNNKILRGTFVGNTVARGIVAGTVITFNGDGQFEGSATDIEAIENNNAGTLRLSGVNRVGEIRAKFAGAHLEFADGFELTGNINKTVLVAITPNLTFLGSGKIDGTIGNAGTGSVGDINIKNNGVVELNTDTIKAVNIFNLADGGGTLALTKQGGDVTIEAKISGNGGGTIDARGMTPKHTLIIKSNIGNDPVNTSSKSLNKIVLGGQNLTLTPSVAIARPGISDFVNIAGIDFSKKESTVHLNTANVNYVLGALENAEKATIEIIENISLYNTTTADKDKLKEIKFIGDKTLTLRKGNNIAAAFISTKTTNEGTIIFDEDKSTLTGPIGSASNKLKAIQVYTSTEATTSGAAYLAEDITLANKSVLSVDSDYEVRGVVGTAAGTGTLRFANKKDKDVKLTTVAVVAPGTPIVKALVAHAIDTLELNGGKVTLVNNGISFKNISFTSKDKSILVLDKAMQLKGISVKSTATERPIIQLVKNDEITASIGDKDHSVELQIGDITLDVKSSDAFIAVSTTDNNKGIVNFDVGAGNKSVIDFLGSENYNLKEANFKTSVENRGSTHVEKATIYDGMTYTASGTVAGGILQVGSSAGGATASFNNGIIIKDNLTSVGTNNKVNFAGDATIIGNIGTSDNRFAEITFNGDKNTTAILSGEYIYAKTSNFGSENIKVAASKSTIGGTANIDGNIDLDSNRLILKGDGTWGANTKINTTLTKDGKLGSIELHDTINVLANLPVHVHVTDLASLDDYRGTPFTLIDGDKYLVLKNGKIILDEIPTTNRAYTKWVITSKDGKQVVTRKVNEREGMKNDLKEFGGDSIDQENVDIIINNIELGSIARKALNDLSYIKDPKARAKSILGLLNTNNLEVNQEVSNITKKIAGIIGDRIATTTRQIAVASGSDDGNTSTMGVWVMPYYSQAVQKKNAGSVGYSVKSGGGIFGFDTLANENLTIGAAVSVAQTDMKFKGYKDEDKTKIGTLGFSLYGSQQLDKDFFVQAMASFSSSKVENTYHRVVSSEVNASGKETAKASYTSTSYGGEVLFGYNAKVADSVLLTPTAGIRYTRFNNESYKETGTKYQNKAISQKADNRVEAIIGARIATTIDTSGVAVTPEAHVSIAQRLNGKSGKVDARLDGMTAPFATRPDKESKTSYNIGVGVSAKAGAMEYGAGYDAYLANKYVGHQGTLKVRINF